MNGSIGLRSRRRSPGSRSGAMVILVAVVMVILLVSAAFSVDIAYMYLINEQLHVASDAAAKAAVVSLAQGGSAAQATSDAVTCAAANTVCGSPVVLVGASDVTLGSVTYSSSGNWAFTPSGTPTTAAQVSARATKSTFFASALGVTSYSSTKTAIAAFVRNKICLVIDRSASMSFDLAGVDWSYPPGTPPKPYNKVDGGNYGYDTPPHPTLSRWATLSSGVASFLAILTSLPVVNMVGMTSFGDSGTTNCTFSATYAPITNAMATYAKSPIIGGTNMADGIQHALSLFSSTDDGTPWNQYIILFSDGQWNVGSDPMTLVSAANSAGVVIHCVGLLNNSGNTTMQDLAAQTGGKYYYASDATTLQAAFEALAKSIPVILTQ